MGVTVVFAVLMILALAMYGIGYLERALIEREKPAVEAIQKPKEEKVKVEEKPAIEPKKLAIITAAILVRVLYWAYAFNVFTLEFLALGGS